MDDLEEYIITCKNIEDQESLYNDLETEGGSETIPERAVPVYKRRPISLNTHYMLTENEASILSTDDRVLDIISVKKLKLVDRKLNSVSQSGTFSKNTLNANYRNWALLRCIEGVNRSGWDSQNDLQTATINYGPTGKNVDIIIMDGIATPYHPEYASRFIQFDWYTLTSTVEELGGSAILNQPYQYFGDSTTNSNHATHVTGTAAGDTCGWARDANIYNIGALGQQYIDWFNVWDYVRAFHKTKPINPSTGRKNPTICNCSFETTRTVPDYWSNITPILSVTRRGNTIGTTLSSTKEYTALTQEQLKSLGVHVRYVSNGSPYVTIPYWNTAESSDITQALDDGIIVVAAAGNDSFYIDKPNGLDWDNTYRTGTDYGPFLIYDDLYLHRGSSVSGTDRVITVGSVSANETKATYSNTGPGIDVFAPGSNIISSFKTNETGFGATASVADNRNITYRLASLSGTSMASPQVTGILACLLEIYPNMTPTQALSYVRSYAKNSQINDTASSFPDWTDDYDSLQGADNKYLYFPQERPTTGELYPKQNHMPRPSSGILYPRRGIRLR